MTAERTRLALRSRSCPTRTISVSYRVGAPPAGQIVVEFGSHPVPVKQQYVAPFADKGVTFLDGEVSGTPGMVIQRKGAAHGLATPISDVMVPLLAAASDGPG